MTQPQLAITGATGALGGRIARLLDQRKLPTRLIVRDRARAPNLAHAEIAQASYEDTSALVAALKGIDTVFFVSGHEAPGAGSAAQVGD